MFHVALVVASLIIGVVLLVIGGVITPKNNDEKDLKFFIMMIGAILILVIAFGVYGGAGKPILFSAKPGYYGFQLTEKNMNEVAGIIKVKEGDNKSVKKFVVIPRKAISNDELLENSKISGLEVIEEVRGYKKIVLK